MDWACAPLWIPTHAQDYYLTYVKVSWLLFSQRFFIPHYKHKENTVQKLSRITPIFNSGWRGDENNANNYRPVYLLWWSKFNVIFEKIVYNRVKDNINKHNLLYSSQYGSFRKDHSTQHAIQNIVNTIHCNMNQGLFLCGVFLVFE